MRYFLSQKVNRKMIFTDYSKVLVLNFFRDGKYGLLLSQKVDERWYLLITGKFLFSTFLVMRNTVFSTSQKSWWIDDVYLVFLNFPWYSRILEIWFFVQWYIHHPIRFLSKSMDWFLYDGKTYLKWQFDKWFR